MNNNAKLWLAALRGGEFHQTNAKLHADDSLGGGFCCLGVACELYRRETGEGAWEGDSFGLQKFVLPDFSESHTLPTTVRDWLGLADTIGGFRHEIIKDREDDGPLHLSCLSEMNDNGCSFSEIAAHIEAEPAGLFTNDVPAGG